VIGLINRARTICKEKQECSNEVMNSRQDLALNGYIQCYFEQLMQLTTELQCFLFTLFYCMLTFLWKTSLCLDWLKRLFYDTVFTTEVMHCLMTMIVNDKLKGL
jgi:hypothetical protein